MTREDPANVNATNATSAVTAAVAVDRSRLKLLVDSGVLQYTLHKPTASAVCQYLLQAHPAVKVAAVDSDVLCSDVNCTVNAMPMKHRKA